MFNPFSSREKKIMQHRVERSGSRPVSGPPIAEEGLGIKTRYKYH